MPLTQSPVLFDDFDETYEEACHQGLALAGESRDYFAAERLKYTATWLQTLQFATPERVADFGCGAGHSVPHLQRLFPGAHVLGLDVSQKAIARAREQYRGQRASFAVLSDDHLAPEQQLVYCNGVFHHIMPDERPQWTARVYKLLTAGGYLALWENNPWNPGTRMVMQRIPFDREAIPLPPSQTRRLLLRSGFEVVGTRFCFYFPRCLRWLRFIERYAVRLPLGAQYCVLARKPQSEKRTVECRAHH